ncbi:MAG TPA: GGDEF domain-containing protein [Caldimonas sp.]|jgi:diguanylate cyclase (GGDEF)-like protein|nr:GGDEF domain-containing protein [Caldimonas sp.]HEX4232856.1 GGDEF domain-containing protein [Caldimonas sp.]
MQLHSPTLLVACATVLVLASVVSASIGLKQGRRGVHWWLIANLLLAAALVVQATTDPDGIAAPIVAILALQWPIITLAGIRRFYARGGSRAYEWSDRGAFAFMVFAVGVSFVDPMGLATHAQIHAMASFSLLLYAASALARLEDYATSSTLQLLRAGLVVTALLQAVWLALGATYLSSEFPINDAALGATVGTTAIALLMTQLSPIMNFERKIAHLLASQRKLRNLVDVDALTRLPNRRHFHELAERAIEAARDAATLIVFDVDQLKRINEVLGHATGDEALRQIGTALRETLRRRDVAGRLGGDEFAVVLPRTRMADSAVVVSRIIARLDDRQVAPRIARVSLNVGSVQFKPNETVGDALRRADAELVRSRDAARNGRATPLSSEDVDAALLDSRSTVSPTPQSAMMSLIPVGDVSAEAMR